MMRIEKCFYCNVVMKKTLLKVGSIKSEGYSCPKCKEKIFTQEQAYKMAVLVDQKRLKDNYVKKAVKIGDGVGFIFPKAMVEVFSINPDKTEFDLKMDRISGKITITIL